MSATTDADVESLGGTPRAVVEARWLETLAREQGRGWWGLRVGALAALAGILLLYGSLASVLVAALSPAGEAPSALVWSGLVAGVVLRFVGGLARDQAGQGLSASVRHALRSRSMTEATHQGPAALAALGSTAWWAQRHLDQVDALHGYLARYVPAREWARWVPIAVVVVVLSQDWIAGLLLLLAIPLVPVFMVLIGLGTQTVQEAQQAREAQLGAELLQRLETLPWLRRVGALRESEQAVAEAAQGHRALVMRVLRVAFLSSSTLELFSALAIGLVALYVGFALLGLVAFGPAASLDAWTGFFVLMLAPEGFLPLRQLAQAYHERGAALAAAASLSSLANHQDVPSPGVASRCAADGDAALVFESVHHGYGQSRRPVLEGLSFKVRPGEIVGLGGPSGSGKSTVMALAAGFLAPDAGRVARGDRWAWVPQRAHLVHGDVRANLQLACEGVVDDAVLVATLESVGLGPASGALPNGLETLIGEQASGVSGGQAQRIGLARALLSGAPLWLLDEPTAALDETTRDRLLEQIVGLARAARVAVLVASHDPVVLAQCDRCITVGEGR